MSRLTVADLVVIVCEHHTGTHHPSIGDEAGVHSVRSRTPNSCEIPRTSEMGSAAPVRVPTSSSRGCDRADRVPRRVAVADAWRDQTVPRCRRPGRRGPGRPPRRGALPARSERRRQVHPDQDHGRLLPTGRGHHPLGRCRRGGPQPDRRDQAGHLHDLPGARSGARSHRRGEHLPRPRDLLGRLQPPVHRPPAGPSAVEQARPCRHRARPAGRQPRTGGTADRQRGAGAVSSDPVADLGRAVGGARSRWCRQPVPGCQGPDRRWCGRGLHLPPTRGDPADR